MQLKFLFSIANFDSRVGYKCTGHKLIISRLWIFLEISFTSDINELRGRWWFESFSSIILDDALLCLFFCTYSHWIRSGRDRALTKRKLFAKFKHIENFWKQNKNKYLKKIETYIPGKYPNSVTFSFRSSLHYLKIVLRAKGTWVWRENQGGCCLWTIQKSSAENRWKGT